METKTKELFKVLYSVYLFALMITFNLFFALFVWKPSDLSPNLAFAIFTIPIAIVEIIKIFKNKEINKKW